MTFYQREMGNVQFIKLHGLDAAGRLSGKNILVGTTYNRLKNKRNFFDSLGYKPVMYSSKILWRFNELLQAKDMPTFNDIWVLYKKE